MKVRSPKSGNNYQENPKSITSWEESVNVLCCLACLVIRKSERSTGLLNVALNCWMSHFLLSTRLSIFLFTHGVTFLAGTLFGSAENQSASPASVLAYQYKATKIGSGRVHCYPSRNLLTHLNHTTLVHARVQLGSSSLIISIITIQKNTTQFPEE